MIDEKNIVVKYGLFDFSKDRYVVKSKEFAQKSFCYILNDLNDLKNKYIRLGFHLDEFDRLEYYKVYGYASFKEFCNENMPLSYSTCMRCINVFLNFSHDRKMFIDEKYQDFSFSQLVEMCSIDSRRRENIKSDWSVEKIRRYKKGLKTQDKEVKNVLATEKDTLANENLLHCLKSEKAMSLICKALQNEVGADCLENLKMTAKTLTFECAGTTFRLQLSCLTKE